MKKRTFIAVFLVVSMLFGMSANALTPQEEEAFKEAQEALEMVKEENAQIAKDRQVDTERAKQYQEALNRLDTANKKLLNLISESDDQKRVREELLQTAR